MSKRIFIVYGHHKTKNCFNASIRDTFVEEAGKLGHKIDLINLHEEKSLPFYNGEPPSEQILDYQNSNLYSDEEKAVLNLSFAAGQAPNKTEDEHLNKLKNYFSKKAIIDIVAVIALFGFLNRWNDTLGTKIEDVPADFLKNNSLTF